MSQVLTPNALDQAAEPTATSFEPREAEQMLIEEARRRQRRRQHIIASIVSAIVAAAGVAYAVASSTTSPKPRPISGSPASLVAFPVCTHLHVSLSGQPQGAAGTFYYTLKLLNNGPRCTVAPIVARGFNTTTSKYVGPWSNVYITSKTKTVVSTGHAAYVPLGVGDSANWPISLCEPVNVNAIRVALAGNHSIIGALALRASVCTVTRSLHTQSASLNPSGL
ncbi:MAG TPA: hypothetical protein VMU68_02140 [Acidimicrobiales bacterium]|nr:hypothetical protein [Acidimicrobiales bacterium]